MIERIILSQLKAWKVKNGRKPLLLFGARQVGKTWGLKQFGKEEFAQCAYFSLDEEAGIADIFRHTKDPAQIIEQLSFLTGTPIIPQETLIVLDEIQECPEALASLKYFCEKAPEYAVACAGSLLGLAVARPGFSFPVGKVDHIDMFPVTFSEFLRAKDPGLHRYFLTVNEIEPLPQVFFDRLMDAFSAYRICGGMPEAASAMIESNVQRVEEVLSNILKDYSLDFIKHTTPALANKISHVWRSLPSQLAKENRKFVYQLVRPGARAREYEDALIWLKNAGIIHQVNLCSEPRLPLSAYEDLSIFKVYANDIGLLRRLAGMPTSIYSAPPEQFKEFKGALAENYVLQSLLAQSAENICYWTSGNTAEIEFLIQHGTSVYPLEVKSGINLKAKSLAQYEKLYAPPLRIRLSMQNLKLDGNILNVPLFLADRLLELV